MVEIEDKNYSELDKEKSFTEFCELIVKTTDENNVTVEDEKEGVQIKGKDVIYLNAPLILPSKDTPLLTEAPDIVGAINELFQSGSGGGDDWQPPDIPEPEDYEIYLLIEVVDVSDRYTSKLEIRLAHPEIVQTGYGPMSIDWGDGTVDEWTEVTYASPDYPDYYGWYNLTHNYAKIGRYLVKISATEYSCFLQRLEPIGSMQYAKIIGAKLGREIVVNNGNDDDVQTAFHKQMRLRYLKLNGKGGLPKSGFFNCFALMRIDIATTPEKIYANQFYNCVNLKSFNFSKVTELPSSSLYGAGFTKLDLPKCVSIGGNGITGCKNLKKINAPSCENVGNFGLSDCWGLEDVKFSDDCIFGNNCFHNCYSLFPRPDGSVN